MQGLQISIRRVSSGDLGKNSSRITHMRRLIEQDTELRRIEPPAARKTRVLQNGEIELDLGNRLVLGLRRQRPYRRQFEGGRIQTPSVCVLDPEQGPPALSPRSPSPSSTRASLSCSHRMPEQRR